MTEREIVFEYGDSGRAWSDLLGRWIDLRVQVPYEYERAKDRSDMWELELREGNGKPRVLIEAV